MDMKATSHVLGRSVKADFLALIMKNNNLLKETLIILNDEAQRRDTRFWWQLLAPKKINK